MQTLAEIQLRFRNAVVDGDVQQVSPMLAGGREPKKRLIVHQRNYHTSLVDALLTKFPATGWLVGTEFLTEAAGRFVREHPPQAPCIAEYGAVFPEFLSHCRGAERVPYLKDFAQLEWYIGQVAIAVDRPPTSTEAFSRIAAEALPDAVLTLQAGLHYLKVSWAVDELMRLYLTDRAPDQFELSTTDVWIEVRGARGEFHFSRLDPADFTFRKSIFQGRPIGHAAEAALDVNASFNPGQALAALVAAGLITAVAPASQGEDS